MRLDDAMRAAGHTDRVLDESAATGNGKSSRAEPALARGELRGHRPLRHKIDREALRIPNANIMRILSIIILSAVVGAAVGAAVAYVEVRPSAAMPASGIPAEAGRRAG